MNDNDLTRGMDVVYEGPRGVFSGRVIKVETTRDFGTVAGKDVILAYIDIGDDVIVTSPRHLSVETDRHDSRVHFAPAGEMRQTADGWRLAINFAGSLQGGVLGGIIVNEHPQGEQAANVLVEWLKQRGGELVFNIPVRAQVTSNV